MPSDKNRTIQQSDPHHADGDYLYLQWNGLMFHEVTDIWSKLRMIQKPVIKAHVASQEKSRRQKQQRCRRQDRKEYSKYAQTK